jgi:predicted RNA binding protein YcfA (HicA-like mRNA interferase family)
VNSYYPKVIAVLQEHGFSFLKSGKGSHEWWSNGTIKVQVPSTAIHATPPTRS